MNGTSLKMEAYILVRWHWLSLPASVLVLQMFLLTYIIWRTHSERIQPFKSSSLAVMFAGLTEQKRRDVSGRVGIIQEMEMTAKQLHVSLQEEDGEYRLR